ncbi:MAG: hypothetical protein WCP20_14205 [Desulfuromonadales bacterium]
MYTGSRNFHLHIWAAVVALLLAAPAIAGIPLEIGLNRSSLLKLEKNVVLATLAHTKASGTNRFVALEPLSPTLLKLDGITIGNTTMILWEQGEGDREPVAVIYDISVTGDSTAIESQLRDISPNEPITVRFANETAVLSGVVSNGQTRLKAENVAKAFATSVINHITTDNPLQVLLQVKVAQVDKTALKKLGISFLSKGRSAEGFINMAGAPTGGISGTTAGLGSLTPLDGVQLGASYFYGGVGAMLQALVTKGVARVLAEPNLLVKSGQEGSFLAGSRIPFNVVASAGGVAATTIVYESVGIRLKFKPEVLENGLINLKIDPAEVSSIGGSMAVNGYPIIDTREVRTNVELRDGESLVLAGLLQEEQIRTMSKIPLLGDIPFLGALFRTIQNDFTDKELVFFITPKIVKPLSAGIKLELPTDRKPTPEEERELNWVPRRE